MFALRLHITPIEMWKMPFYDIMLLYRAYEEYVNKENEEQTKQQEQYEQQAEDYKANMPNPSDYKMPDINNISRGFTNSMSGFTMPNF